MSGFSWCPFLNQQVHPMVYRMERIEEVPHLEGGVVEAGPPSIFSPTKDMPTWATRGLPNPLLGAHIHDHGMAECQVRNYAFYI